MSIPIRRAPLWLVPALVFPAWGACVGTDVGNGRTSIELSASGFEQVSSTTQALTLGSGTRIDELYVVIDRLRLEPGESCDSGSADEEIDVEGPVVIDLVGQGILGGPVVWETEAGSFCRFRMSFHKLEGQAPAGAPADLAGLSILVRGETSEGVPFEIRSERGDEVELRADGAGFELSEGRHTLFLGYELKSWVDAVDLPSLGTDPILIDKDTNSDLLEAFEAAVESSASLFEDEDGDGALSTDEREEDDALASGSD